MLRIRDLAATRTRYGYFRIYILLRREGWIVNHKRVYRDDGLSLRLKRPRRNVSAAHRERQPAASQIVAMPCSGIASAAGHLSPIRKLIGLMRFDFARLKNGQVIRSRGEVRYAVWLMRALAQPLCDAHEFRRRLLG